MAADPQVTILVDLHEMRTVVPTTLEALGVRVVTVALDVGDYHVGGDALVERKSVRDLHESVVRGRFWRQIGVLRTGCREPYLVLEGRNIDDGTLSPTAVRGVCVAAVDLGVRLLRTDDHRDSARWLVRLAVRKQRRRHNDRPLYAQRPKRESAQEAMLAAVPGISAHLARRLLSRFGTVAAVVVATPEELCEVQGVGTARAEALTRAINGPL